MNIKGLVDMLKLNTRTKFAIALSASALLLFRKYAIYNWNASSFYEKYSMYIFIIMLIFWALLITEMLSNSYTLYKRKAISRTKKLRLKKLINREKEIVTHMYNIKTHAEFYRPADSAIMSLESKGIIMKSSRFSVISPMSDEDYINPPFIYILQPWTVEYCNKHKRKYKDN